MIFVFDPAYREVRTWTHGEIEGPCFTATITFTLTGEKNRAAVIECAYELQHYLSAVKGVVVEHVHMMCPPTVSGRSEWALEKLESIVAFQGVATNANAVVYQTAIASYKVGDLDLRKKRVHEFCTRLSISKTTHHRIGWKCFRVIAAASTVPYGGSSRS